MKGKNTAKSNDDLFLALSMKDPNPSFTNEREEIIRTDDLGLAIAIFHRGATLLSVEKENPDKIIFIFKKIINFQDMVDEFYGDTFNVKAFSFLQSIKDFKKRVDSKLKLSITQK